MNKERVYISSFKSGEVIGVGVFKTYGKYVFIKHDPYLTAVYTNFEDVFVEKGEMLSAGDVLGAVTMEVPDDE